MKEPVVGVIGGMGPEATVELMRRVIAATPAEDDCDHIHMIVDNNPKIPSRIKAIVEGVGESPGPALATMARRLERAGADFLVIPCNTAHYYWSSAAEAVTVPVLHLVELTLASVTERVGAPARVGMLASPALRKVGLYEARCDAHGVSLLYPRREQELLEVIRAIKAGRADSDQIQRLERAAAELTAAGADGLVLGCTEFALVADRLRTEVPVFDTLQVLVDRIVAMVKTGADATVAAGATVTSD